MTQSSLTTLSHDLIGAAIEVHSLPGPGLLESIYEECMDTFISKTATA